MTTVADILGSRRKAPIPEKWAHHYQWLCAERDRLLERDDERPESFNVKIDDLTEAASEEIERDMSLVAANAAQGTLVEVLDAIRRIEGGTYGVCEMTGLPIEPDRLQAIPWVRYSMLGQKQIEQDGLGRRIGLPAICLFNQESQVEPETEEEASTAS